MLSVALKLGLNLGVINIAIYGKKVRCSFNSFEQCIYILYNMIELIVVSTLDFEPSPWFKPLAWCPLFSLKQVTSAPPKLSEIDYLCTKKENFVCVEA